MSHPAFCQKVSEHGTVDEGKDVRYQIPASNQQNGAADYFPATLARVFATEALRRLKWSTYAATLVVDGIRTKGSYAVCGAKAVWTPSSLSARSRPAGASSVNQHWHARQRTRLVDVLREHCYRLTLPRLQRSLKRRYLRPPWWSYTCSTCPGWADP